MFVISIHCVAVRGDEPVREGPYPRILDDPAPLRQFLEGLDPRPETLMALNQILLEVPEKTRRKIPGLQDLLDNGLWIEMTNPGSLIAI